VQGEPVKEARGTLALVVKVTLPDGVVAVPVSLSVTVAVQVVWTPRLTDDGLHVTAVLVVRIKVNWTVVILPS